MRTSPASVCLNLAPPPPLPPSQSTLLLQKKKAMQEVQLELDRKKAEFEQRMRKVRGGAHRTGVHVVYVCTS